MAWKSKSDIFLTLGIRDSLATIIRDVAELNKDDIKSCFDGRPVPIAGYLCEIRMNETCLGIGKEFIFLYFIIFQYLADLSLNYFFLSTQLCL